MDNLEFEALELEDYDRVYRYMSEYGEGSCQHSFVSMYSLHEKYGDMICESENTLYTLRSHLCDDRYRVYLAPFGSGEPKEAFLHIFADAERHGKKVRFWTLTEAYAKLLEELFPERFLIEEQRDLFEYMYYTNVMATFPGRKLHKRRSEANQFRRLYGEDVTVCLIEKKDFEDMLVYEDQWIHQNMETHDMDALQREARMIKKQLEYYDELHLSGVVLRYRGEVRGFSYGTKLSDAHFDAIAEKGDRDLEYIYRVLRQESVKQCAMDCTYVNMEEDVGVPGLRSLKLSYKPEYLLRKYIATER